MDSFVVDAHVQLTRRLFAVSVSAFCFWFASETVSVEQRLLSVPELSHHLAESYLTCCLFLQEMLQYKQQNHGKVRNSRQDGNEDAAHSHLCHLRAA